MKPPPAPKKRRNAEPVVEKRRLMAEKLKSFATPFLTKDEGESLRRDLRCFHPSWDNKE
ncbi:MAG: hypothetical protein LBP75_03095 [Planctomycetota bacterium]|jgi:hypothetical protein|nr:hypothetical protein [Planctomycetota bacterium]